MMGYGYGMGYGLGHGFGFLFILLLVVLIVVAIFALVRAMGRQGAAHPPSTGGDRAVEILRERYARGEITKEQFDEMQRELTR